MADGDMQPFLPVGQHLGRMAGDVRGLAAHSALQGHWSLPTSGMQVLVTTL